MNNLMIKHMKMKFKNLIKITSILVFSIIVVACSDDSYNSNMDESTEEEYIAPSEEYIAPSNDKQNICSIHNIQLDTSNDGSTYCLKCLSDSQQDAEARDAEANAIEEAEIQSQQEKTYKCKWCGINFYSPGYSFNYSTTRNQCDIEEEETYNFIYCSRKCANEACWSEH